MSNPLQIRDNIVNRITCYHLIAFLATLAFDRFYNQLVFISLLLHTIIHLKKTSFRQIDWKPMIIIQSVFFITVICTSWSAYAANGMGAWEKQIAIFLFPLIFVLNDIKLKKHGDKILTGFAYVITLVIIYLYYDALRIIAWYDFPLKKLFTVFFLNHNFSKPIDLHATYLSLYVAIAILVFFQNLIRQLNNKRTRLIYLFCMLILSAGLVQLASRSVLIGFLVIINLVLPFYFSQRKKRLQFVGLSMLLSAIVIFCILRMEGLNFRLVQGLKNDLTTSSLKYSVSDPRAKRWDLAIDLIKESPVIGYGTGSEIPMLKQAYFDNRLYDSYLNDLNAHNQYFSFLLKGGLVALFIYLFTLAWAFRLAIRSRDLLFLSFLGLIVIAGISENIMDVNKGIFFYAFFLSFFVVKHLKKPSKSVLLPASGNSESLSNVFIYKEELTLKP